MLGNMKPFRLAGNIYYVGTYEECSHLIVTEEGLILIDVGGNHTAQVVLESVETLGFDIRDLKYILLSHGHFDHSDGAPIVLAAAPGAKVCICAEDEHYLKGYHSDIHLQDGEVIRLGSTAIRCVHTPGHTEGTTSFFLDVEVDGKILRAGMFGGAGPNQLRKGILDQNPYSATKKGVPLPYALRGKYFESVARLKQEHVDIFLGNHCWNNRTREKYEESLTSETNPFIDPEGWKKFLEGCDRRVQAVIDEEITTEFVNYAHRGASEYTPENTMMAFYTGLYMGANGIETDVRRTKDGVLVLFHDSTVERKTEGTGAVEDMTFEELQALNVTKNGYTDKIVRFEDFLQHFAFRDITFAIELKGPGVEEGTAELLRKYGMEKKTVVTSFKLDYLRKFKAYAPEFRAGFLTSTVDDDLIAQLKEMGVEELCPKATLLTKENVLAWHRMGFRVRAWGLTKELMVPAYEAGIDGMTVNFPDLLAEHIRKVHPATE